VYDITIIRARVNDIAIIMCARVYDVAIIYVYVYDIAFIHARVFNFSYDIYSLRCRPCIPAKQTTVQLLQTGRQRPRLKEGVVGMGLMIGGAGWAVRGD